MCIRDSSTEGTTTPIIDVENSAEYIGPTKLAGLPTDLTDTEKSSIRTKLDVTLAATVLLPRLSGLWFDFDYTSPFSGAEQMVLELDSNGNVTLVLTQLRANPIIDYRDWIRSHDLIELINKDDDTWAILSLIHISEPTRPY